MQIGYLGAGTWGFALANILAKNGHKVLLWSRDKVLINHLNNTGVHPKLKSTSSHENLYFTNDLNEAIDKADVIVESVTSSGIRPVFQKIGKQNVPIIITSKGIEQGTGMLLPEVIASIFGSENLPDVGVLTGPSLADDLILDLPTSVVASGYRKQTISLIRELFSTPFFRIYPNDDIHGVCFGGAMKNIIAIACGIADGLNYGENTKAALMTRGLHEIRKLSVVKKCKPDTLIGLSGMGDLCVTCMSVHSRNYRFGKLLAQGFSPEGARQKIAMAVEGIYSCVSARQLALEHHIQTPITFTIYDIIYNGLDPRDAVKHLLQRQVKDEML